MSSEDSTSSIIDCSLKSHIKNKKDFDYFKELSKIIGFPIQASDVSKGKNMSFHPYIWEKIGRHVRGDLSGGDFWGNRIISFKKRETQEEKCFRCKRILKNVWFAEIFKGMKEETNVKKQEEDLSSFPFRSSIGNSETPSSVSEKEEKRKNHVTIRFEKEKAYEEDIVEYYSDSGRNYCSDCKKKVDKLKKCILM